MTSKSSSDSSASVEAKLVWNSPLDAEEIFEVKMAELKATLIKESVYHCVSEKESNERLAVRPPRSQEGQPSYATRYTAWEKSLKDLSDDANTAMGTLMALFDPDCNAHRELAAWYDEDLTANAPSSRKRRKDYNFRNAWSKFHELYRPNKEVNLDTILKRWEALTDEEISFATFQGQYHKLIKEMEVIGQPPTEAKRYEMLRRNVKNPHLEYLVVQLSLPEARRIKLETFFEDCNHVTRYNKEWDSGHKRKAEEVFGRQVTIKTDMPDSVPNAVCWRCGLPGHLKFNIKKSLACTSTTCSLCKARIGGDSHDARYCCEKSSKVFPNASRVDRPAKKRNTGKSRKPGAGRGKPSSSSSSSSRPNHTPLSKPFSYDTHGEAVKDVPKDVIAAMVTLNRYHKAGGASERRAASAEENSSSK